MLLLFPSKHGICDFTLTSLHTFALSLYSFVFFFFFQAEDGIRDLTVTGVQTCALPISHRRNDRRGGPRRVDGGSLRRRVSQGRRAAARPDRAGAHPAHRRQRSDREVPGRRTGLEGLEATTASSPTTI